MNLRNELDFLCGFSPFPYDHYYSSSHLPFAFFTLIPSSFSCVYISCLTGLWFFSLLYTGEFKSVIGCEDEVIQLKCNRSSRLAIYSANYGRTEYESVQCPQPTGVPEECKIPAVLIYVNHCYMTCTTSSGTSYCQYISCQHANTKNFPPDTREKVMRNMKTFTS